MRNRQAHDAAALCDITVPSRPGRMAGFSDRTKDPIDLHMVPYPAVTVGIDLGDGLLVDHATGQQRGSVVVGLAPGEIRVRGRGIECLQMRLSPMVAYAVLGAGMELDETLVALDDLWGRDAVRTQEQLAGWSRKRLWSRFRSQTGMTPKRAAQLIRFGHAAHRLAAGHRAALVAVESGYADRSHLHRDVKAFASVTPAVVADAPWLAVDDIAWAVQN